MNMHETSLHTKTSISAQTTWFNLQISLWIHSHSRSQEDSCIHTTMMSLMLVSRHIWTPKYLLPHPCNYMHKFLIKCITPKTLWCKVHNPKEGCRNTSLVRSGWSTAPAASLEYWGENGLRSPIISWQGRVITATLHIITYPLALESRPNWEAFLAHPRF